MALLAELCKNISLGFQQTKDFLNQSVNSFTTSAQQIGESWQERASQATHRTVDTVTTTLEQAKASVEQTLQSADKVKNTTSVAVQTAISSAMSHWFEQHPTLLRLVQILGWAANHPIISLVILVFALAVIWSLIKAIGRIVESASLSVLQVPLKLLQAVAKFSFVSFTKVGSLVFKQLTDTKTTDSIPTVLPTISPIHKDNQQRLVEISTRLEEIQQEQNQLLQEAAELLASEKIDREAQMQHYIK
ncbi:hypothetical protein [Brasilonema bromeliae]|uniref:Uncharacterized protein n=1 Tax=Brasilonema bromeliae SPC951 TaxID=385972 RepID=A0ABX1P850_9CYAN|nr:hypothetical protein [Brasilonema bromeliae]NMG20589.1 hypothetical protein [Brasilonema bromeliae SPC951]